MATEITTNTATPQPTILQSLIQEGLGILAKIDATKSNISTSEAIKEQLYQNSTNIQSLINRIMTKNGIVTQNELDALDEEIRQSKLKLLESEASNSRMKYALYVVGVLAIVGTAWYFTYKKL
jgi:hypothetical protein